MSGLRGDAGPDLVRRSADAAGADAAAAVGSGTTPRLRHPRRVAVVGSERFRRVVAQVAPGGVAVVASVDVADVPLLAPLTWDETVVEAESWQALRERHPREFARAAVIAVPADPRQVAVFLRRPFGPVAGSVKRLVDVALAAVLLILTSPLLAVAGAAILLETGRPAIFAQMRVGVGGRGFTLYKLRTMARDAAEHEAEHAAYVTALMRGEALRNAGLFKLVHDARVTRVGALLRRSSIDELPQLWNVLRGQMSLIGPRPMMQQESELLTAGQWGRFRVRPGLTGPWQVHGRSALSFDEMVRLDIDYWQHWSPRADLVLLLRTPFAVLRASSTA